MKLLNNVSGLVSSMLEAFIAATPRDAAAIQKILVETVLGRVRDTYDPNNDGVVDDTTGICGKRVAGGNPSDGDGLVFSTLQNKYVLTEIPSSTNTYWKDAGTLSDLEWTGTAHYIAFSETASPGEVVYVNSSSKASKAKANALTTIPVAYMALETVAAGDVVAGTKMLVLVEGCFRNDAWAAWTVGGSAGMLYLDETTAGAMSQSVPSSGNYLQALGLAVASKVVSFRPDAVWTEMP